MYEIYKWYEKELCMPCFFVPVFHHFLNCSLFPSHSFFCIYLFANIFAISFVFSWSIFFMFLCLWVDVVCKIRIGHSTWYGVLCMSMFFFFFFFLCFQMFSCRQIQAGAGPFYKFCFFTVFGEGKDEINILILKIPLSCHILESILCSDFLQDMQRLVNP